MYSISTPSLYLSNPSIWVIQLFDLFNIIFSLITSPSALSVTIMLVGLNPSLSLSSSQAFWTSIALFSGIWVLVTNILLFALSYVYVGVYPATASSSTV